MTELIPSPSSWVPRLIEAASHQAANRFLEFFAANIRNKQARRAYSQAVREFLAWCEGRGVGSIADVKPLHVAVYIDGCGLADDPKGRLFWTIC